MVLRCSKCKYTWETKLKNKLPKQCPKCKRYDWREKQKEEIEEET